MSGEPQTAFTLTRGIHRGVPGEHTLSLFVYTLLPGLGWLLPGVWEETITASLHRQIVLQTSALRGKWILALLPYLGKHSSRTDDTASDK